MNLKQELEKRVYDSLTIEQVIDILKSMADKGHYSTKFVSLSEEVRNYLSGQGLYVGLSLEDDSSFIVQWFDEKPVCDKIILKEVVERTLATIEWGNGDVSKVKISFTK